MADFEADYIIVGGGLSGCALASRLRQGNPNLDILVIEAGVDPAGNPNTTTSKGAFELLGSDLNWAYQTTPQLNLNDRAHKLDAGKVLGGGSILNFGGWARGDASDYDEWARLVGDKRWSYQGMLPCFRKTEHYFDSSADPEQYGFSGPMHITSISASDPKRRYPLREPMLDAWTELGIKRIMKPSSGTLAGISEFLENWYEGQRQPAHFAYNMNGVRIMTCTMVHRVLFSKDNTGNHVAVGVLLADGRELKVRKEIILSAGALRTPQILMLSGIGSAEKLSTYDIPVISDSPHVGKNLHNHFAHFQLWKLRNPEKGLAMGSPLMTDPAFFKGLLPCDWVVNEAVPLNILGPAIQQDEAKAANKKSNQDNSLLDPARCHVETIIIYSSMGAPPDGTLIATSTMLLLPTSRGSVTISSTSPNDPPVIDTNDYATKADQVSLIHGTRRTILALTETNAGKAYIESEVTPPGIKTLDSTSTDGEIDARIRATGVGHAHSAGSAAMGLVVDTELRVKGVKGVRVADASVLPISIGGHPQATLYALAEQAAEMILKGV